MLPVVFTPAECPRRNGRGTFYFSLGRRLVLSFFVLALALAPAAAWATHIVGGQLGMQYVSRGVYDLSFTLYFDGVNGNPGAFDSVATVVTYERGLGRAGTMDTIALPLFSRVRVQYTNPGCQSSSLITDEVRYVRRVFLNPARYASPAGYYVAWQRASRNYVITNLDYILPGSNPPVFGQDVGQTFVLQFPALQAPGGGDFINSSPTGFLPLRDYACIQRPFRYGFGGFDPDGDSLVYDLVSPLQYVLDSLSTNFTIPVPGPAPYPPIVWAPGYDSTRQIPGPQPLRINRRTGELQFTANQAGLYVFAVRVREYRGTRLLGEMRREFQELVVACSLNQTPRLVLTVPAPPRTGALLTNGQIVQLPAAGDPGERCLNIYATDPDTTTRLRLRVVPVDSLFVNPAISITTGVVNVSGRRDSLFSRLCFATCFTTNNRPLRLWIIAEDEGCPQPQPDTVLLLVNAAGAVAAPTTIGLNSGQLAYTVTPGATVAFAVTGASTSGLPVTVGAVSVNGGPLSGAVGLVSLPTTAVGTATALVTWAVTCATPPGVYRLNLRAATPGALCYSANASDTVVTVTVVPGPDAPASIRLRFEPGSGTPTGPNLLTTQPGNVVRMTVTGTDADNDLVTVELTDAPSVPGSPLAGLPISTQSVPGAGTETLNLTWPIACETPPGTYLLRFRATTTATNGCRPLGLADTAAYITVLPGAATFDAVPPNIITPNGDHLNDRFAPRLSRSGDPADCEAATLRQLRIFNRWGRQIFATTDPQTGWPGGDVASGTYYYLLEYTNRASVKGWVEVVL